jgi:hypothetical protein
MSEFSPPVLDLEAEAQQISVQAVPGAIFFRLRREREDGTIRRMFIEMTIGEAIAFSRELDSCIDTAAATSGP